MSGGLGLLKRVLTRSLKIQSYAPYERFLQALAKHEDVWVTALGPYLAWWRQRATSKLRIALSAGVLQAETDLPDAVMEICPGQWQAATALTLPCPESDFSGEVWIAIDPALELKHLLKEALEREGILNYVEADSGPFLLSGEVAPTLERMARALRETHLDEYHQCILDIRQIVAERLAQHQLPLVRLWYYPCVAGKTIKTVVSARYDVDRALTNMPKIWALEHKYGASSTAHMRPFGPFYSQRTIARIARHPLCAEVAVHGEFVAHAPLFGGVPEAAAAERRQLAELTGREVSGMSLHGGELIENNTPEALRAAVTAGFSYDVSMPPASYYFPYRLESQPGTLEDVYRVRFGFGDIMVRDYEHYGEVFYRDLMRVFETIHDHHGVFIVLLHPIYFGLGSYLLNGGNLLRLLRFVPTYFRRLLGAGAKA
ncbi:MAG TPA: hypothetical protein PKH77_14715 [Anaerolineae bacterium]|nr:hypothetical protein [Anaerolineae bacterium]